MHHQMQFVEVDLRTVESQLSNKSEKYPWNRLISQETMFYWNEMMLGQFTFSLNVPGFIDVKSVILLTFSNIKVFLDLEI